MKITLGQIRVYTNNPEKNYQQILKVVQENKDSSMIVFPQLALSGLHIGEALKDKSLQDDYLRYNEEIRSLSHDSVIVFGNLHKEDNNLYNAIHVAYKGEWLTKPHLKEDLSPYEEAYFTRGSASSSFEFENESYHLSFGETRPDQFTLVLDTKPYQEGIYPKPFLGVYLNHVGISNTGDAVYVYDGGSFISDGSHCMSALDNFMPSSQSFDMSHFAPNQIRISNKLYNGLIALIQYFDEEALPYGPKWLVGVSGGLDSSVSVSLLVDALGKDRVMGINMPSQFTRDITKSNASHLSEKLGFDMLTIPVGDMVDATVASFNKVGYDSIQGLSYENIQARLRGHTLMTLSSLENGVVCNNGNKVECAFGYATLYGDAIGALAILADLNKIELGQLALDYNDIHNDEIIPSNLIPELKENNVEWDFAPSAELAQDQFDPMKWAYHDFLLDYLFENSVESFMEMYLDASVYETLPGRYLKAYGLDNPSEFIKDLEWVLRTKQVAVYKRVQSPPVAKVSSLTFKGESQGPYHYTKEYYRLKEAILKM